MLETHIWKKELDVAGHAARAAGRILVPIFGQVNHVIKKGVIDLVTEADLQAEQTIVKIISDAFPQDDILSEEAGDGGKVSDRTWLVDPLDGTTNFVHGFPFFATSIALEIEEEIVLGVVYNPYMDEYFEALKGAGAYLNNIPIQVSKTQDVGESLLATGFPYDIRERSLRIMEVFRKMLIMVQGVRRPGSAAIDLCYVAAGRLDGFWEEGLNPWDTAAAVVIVKEAGGKLTTFDGGYYTPYQKSIVAANPFIHDAMMSVLNR
ncbi:MAG: inositol monophosphatase family protein [Thermodesulfobacteriota bacterium]|nr:inositol monophosphatase family protein [Thermodesulfobacteriota bacterium]